MLSSTNIRTFSVASAVILLLAGFAIVFPQSAAAIFDLAQGWTIENFGWFYVTAVVVFFVLMLWLAIGPMGRLKLGPDDSEPDFPFISWVAMLFAAGMGIGLMYFGVAEPVQHYIAPPEAEPGTMGAAREAMAITYTHWGLHGWSIYGLVGLALGYFAHRKGLPLAMRSVFHPLIGDRIYGPWGDLIDIFAICGTLFGISTSLGLGVSQIVSGLSLLFGIPNTPLVQVLLIFVVVGLATVSVLSGVGKGVRRLSELNLILAICLMLFILLAGPTLFLIRAYVQNFGLYLDHFVIRSFQLYAYEPRAWLADWTLFYWAWWIAWSPFVGMFIARISRGRTVREFIISVLTVPTAFTFLWMTVFGNSAMALDMGVAQGAISAAVQSDLSTALFKFLEYFPWPMVTSGLAIALVMVFFVTSADSGALILANLSAKSTEDDDAPGWLRVYWAVLLALVSSALLIAGGLSALQTATLVAALPFAVILLLTGAGLIRQMNADLRGEVIEQAAPHLGARLRFIFAPATRAQIERQITQSALPALQEVHDALSANAELARLDTTDEAVSLGIDTEKGRPFHYRVTAGSRPRPALTAAEARRNRREVEWRMMVSSSDGKRPRDITGFTREQVVGDVLEHLHRWRANL
ncbi:BCCT family transporter [uncultured Brevundimonas sp.]|uniref:BCCT family transporter n=1 Tax=uncultured Brevundimonas sp. TaxID=213418 RepID=UPI00261F2232|nr:BCCT family transporter [uncultured Brevundimonas sp.]